VREVGAAEAWLGQRMRRHFLPQLRNMCPNQDALGLCLSPRKRLGAGGDSWGGLVVLEGTGDGFDGVDQAGARTGYVGVAIDGPQRGVGKMMSDGLRLGHCGIQVKTARRNEHHIGIAGLSLGPRNGG
jgi:hypothetical protein